MNESSMQIGKPPTIMIAKGFCISEPILVEIAAGANPIDPIKAIIKIGRIRLMVPNSMALFKLDFLKFSRMTAIKMMALIVLTPNKMMKPMPAEMPKIVPVIQSDRNPPMNANGMLQTAIMVSLRLLKLKYNKNKINNKTAGTTIINCLLALSLLSNSPAHSI